ncbi:glutamyl-Q tRNA(Asp) synthetase [Alicyclobacillus acidoterrestris]|nr:glutamyl-Q tRNA(Asp) synthetase [Alicyclobacillus acidoterrestris]
MRRGRFAPSPTGELHIGNAFTAVLSWLQMRSAYGAFVLRVEDIDGARSKREYVQQALADLRWLGLDWDEGPDVDGPYGPYCQQERLSLYEKALLHLEALGRLYPCFCSRAQLAQVASAPHGLFADEPRYPGTCRDLTPAQQAELAVHKHPALRFRVPDGETSFVDAVAGIQRVDMATGGDFIVRRADGVFAYQLAVVVDDAEMGVTDVLRGMDLLSSTPRQIALYNALGKPIPTFAHVPIVLDVMGQRLAKRNRSITLRAMREAGVAAEEILGVIGYLAGFCDTCQPISLDNLTDRFEIAKVPKHPVRLDPTSARVLHLRDVGVNEEAG